MGANVAGTGAFGYPRRQSFPLLTNAREGVIVPKTAEEKRAYFRAWEAQNREKRRSQRRASYARNPEKQRARRRAWRAANREKDRASNRAWYERNREQKRASSHAMNYGVSPKDYHTLLALQSNRCAICRAEQKRGRALGVDHDHRTGKVRGLLCDRCNMGLGHFHDDPEKLRAAVLYVTQGGQDNEQSEAGRPS